MMEEEKEINELEPEEIVALPARQGEFDSQIVTAKQYPRSISKFRKEAESMATLDEETAGECLYALPRKGKTIEGPSVRLAEIILYSWGNARADAEIVEENNTHVVSMGTFFDLERNVAIRKKVSRRIVDKHGIRYNEDMITVTSNAANSIALRNAVFGGIPKAIWKPIWQKARLASLGKGGTLTQKRQAMVDWFNKLGIENERIFDLLGVDGIEDIKEDQLITMRGLANAIKEGEATVEEAFARPGSINGDKSADLQELIEKEINSPLIDPGSDLFKATVATCNQLGINDTKQKAWIKAHFGKESPKELTVKEFQEFVRWVSNHERKESENG